MAHERPTIVATPRERLGTHYAQRLRKSGRLPAVIYGHKQTPVAVSVAGKDTLLHIQHGTHVFNVDVEGGGTETCLVKDLQFGYLGDEVIHIDFARVDLDEEVTVLVHLTWVGEPHDAARGGAVLRHDIAQLEVVCKVNQIPEDIKVDLATMREGHPLTVGELILPPGVISPLDPSTSVAHVSFVHDLEDEVEVGEEADVAAPAEPEVITESKASDEKTKES